ncbi:DUF3618 domain-containing protein [Salinibacterium sp. G-O1]|uniref:DUF3618 domain-containing protein n=1 Tax=Salinibacterium sp. G-O1 TaxID=3046208 RepID=UPI0024BAF4C9|nr:DUF3618 domain-containing protein [Salinibacterium sp. G-O1]MDJ0333633.1 DUF3618 domain-containing protein [Salinibacterium sp. G-O1]
MSDVESRIQASRAELEATLDAIEEKLNVPKHVEELTEKVRTSYEANPMPWIIGGIATAVVAVGVVAWAILSNDD